MLDAFTIISKSGVVLFSYVLEPLRGKPIDALIQQVLLEERGSLASFVYEPYTLKWLVANELGLVFVAIHQKSIRVTYAEDLLAAVDADMRTFNDGTLLTMSMAKKTVTALDYRERFARVLRSVEDRVMEAKSVKKPKSFEDTAKFRKAQATIVKRDANSSGKLKKKRKARRRNKGSGVGGAGDKDGEYSDYYSGSDGGGEDNDGINANAGEEIGSSDTKGRSGTGDGAETPDASSSTGGGGGGGGGGAGAGAGGGGPGDGGSSGGASSSSFPSTVIAPASGPSAPLTPEQIAALLKQKKAKGKGGKGDSPSGKPSGAAGEAATSSPSPSPSPSRASRGARSWNDKTKVTQAEIDSLDMGKKKRRKEGGGGDGNGDGGGGGGKGEEEAVPDDVVHIEVFREGKELDDFNGGGDDGDDGNDHESAAGGSGSSGSSGSAASGKGKGEGKVTNKGWGVMNFFQSLTGNKVLERADIEGALDSLKAHLKSKNVAADIADTLCESVATNIVGEHLPSLTRVHTAVRDALERALVQILTPARSVDILREVRAAQEAGVPYKIVFMGVNGVGKSTNLSKVCHWLKQNGFKVMIAACDTFRSGAVEQLKTHARRLQVELFEAGYAPDDAGVARAAVRHAQKQGADVLLIDTAGRMQGNIALMQSLAKLVDAANPNLVLFVGEALVGNDAVDQLTKFNQIIRDYSSAETPHTVDGILLTKFDTIDDKVGAAISMVYSSKAPIVFVGTGQNYTDLRKMNVESVVKALLK